MSSVASMQVVALSDGTTCSVSRHRDGVVLICIHGAGLSATFQVSLERAGEFLSALGAVIDPVDAGVMA